MATLNELIKPGVPAKLKREMPDEKLKYYWDGTKLFFLNIRLHFELWQLGSDWQLDEPTVDDVLEKRGWEMSAYPHLRVTCYRKIGQISNHQLQSSKPTTAAEMTRIIDFLESLQK